MRKILKYSAFGVATLAIGLFTPHEGASMGSSEVYSYDQGTGGFSCTDTCSGETMCCKDGEPVWPE